MNTWSLYNPNKLYNNDRNNHKSVDNDDHSSDDDRSDDGEDSTVAVNSEFPTFSGSLNKRARAALFGRKSWKQRYFVLRNGLLVWYSVEKEDRIQLDDIESVENDVE